MKVASGHWNVFDPTNGYVAIRGDVLRSLDLAGLAEDYFFSLRTGRPATAGTVMLAALPCLAGFQLLLQALNFEISGRLNRRVTPDSAVDG